MLKLTSALDKNTKSKAKDYWVGASPNSEIAEQMHKELVPFMGPAKTAHGEILRIASMVLYHYYNDGIYWFGEDTEDGFEVNTETKHMLANLVYIMPKQFHQLTTTIKDKICQGCDLTQTGELDELMDCVVFTINNSEDQNI